MNPNCNRDPLTCRCWYHQGHVDEPPETTKPVVTQAALKPCPFCGGVPELVGNTLFCRSKTHQTFGIHRDEWNTRAHSSQAVATQDLVPVAWMYERKGERTFEFNPEGDSAHWLIDNGWNETPLHPASAIEAAQIAARNDALDLDWVRVAKLAGEHGIRYRTNAALVAFLSALRTPSQHQEEQ